MEAPVLAHSIISPCLIAALEGTRTCIYNSLTWFRIAGTESISRIWPWSEPWSDQFPGSTVKRGERLLAIDDYWSEYVAGRRAFGFTVQCYFWV